VWFPGANSDKLLQRPHEPPDDLSQRTGCGHYAAYFPPPFGSFYPAVFWSYTVAFGFSHIGNFADGVTINNILFIVPHTLTGLVLGYIRIKDGLGYAVVLHGCINYLHENWSFS
jgi:hypothetical protein